MREEGSWGGPRHLRQCPGPTPTPSLAGLPRLVVTGPGGALWLGPRGHLSPPFRAPAECRLRTWGASSCSGEICVRRVQRKKECVQLIPSHLGDFQDAERKKAKEWVSNTGTWCGGVGGCRGGIESIYDYGRNLKENSRRPAMAAAALVASGRPKSPSPREGWEWTWSGKTLRVS